MRSSFGARAHLVVRIGGRLLTPVLWHAKVKFCHLSALPTRSDSRDLLDRAHTCRIDFAGKIALAKLGTNSPEPLLPFALSPLSPTNLAEGHDALLRTGLQNARPKPGAKLRFRDLPPSITRRPFWCRGVCCHVRRIQMVQRACWKCMAQPWPVPCWARSARCEIKGLPCKCICGYLSLPCSLERIMERTI